MKRLKTIVLPIAMFFAFTNISQAGASTHTVNEGESLWSISMDYGVSIEDIKELNGKPDDSILAGEELEIPTSANAEEEDLLARIIHAEAKGEPYEGKIAVGHVILNRVADDQFPDSIYEVVHEVTPEGAYQFSPVLDGSIHEPAGEESKQAAREALANEGQAGDSLFFYNPEKATNYWNATREETKTIGNHVFAR
ncbi:N-acetylmuramoyl-L-alanine amidase [Geomicrobium halophilum]|uniref:N-acetylmuramoyl-L-alanine amidase n=1 Tax=Geomicrobium halophilum TaxID=549000 RepID=A0A841PX94_9BACL|nr:cell wall hydrolase [Geomicrobium halophilum]MBB6451261.1 N-acetylmuramoyl-L-alanine amidase [Geomicrobium halophilum]